MTRGIWGFGPGDSSAAVRGWGLRLLLGAVWLAALALPSFAGEQRDEGDPPALRIGVRVVSYVPVPREEMAEALEEATLLFARVGVETQWVLCGASVEESEMPAACDTPLERGELALRIVPDPKGMPSTSRDALGHAMVLPRAQDSYLASLFYDRVQSLAEDARCLRAVVLGHAMAHELGHLLLGTLEHSSQGLMRGRWDGEDLGLAQRRSFRFMPQQVEQIRAGLRARLRARQASLRDAAKVF